MLTQIINARILTPQGWLKDGSVIIRDNKILAVTDCDKTKILLQEGETVSYKWLNEQDFIKFVNSKEMIEAQRNRYKPYLEKMGYLN